MFNKLIVLFWSSLNKNNSKAHWGTAKVNSSQLAELLVSYFDMDMQIYTSKVLEQLRDTSHGQNLAAWAKQNRGVFSTLLRVSSVAIKRFPHDDNLVLHTITEHLSRLPADTFRIFGNPSVRAGTDRIMSQEECDEMLIQNSGDDLLIASTLPHNQLREWDATTASQRPVLIDGWTDRDKAPNNFLNKLATGLAVVPDTLLEVGDALIPEVDDTSLFRRIFRREIDVISKLTSRLRRWKGAK